MNHGGDLYLEFLVSDPGVYCIIIDDSSMGVAPCVDFAHWHARTGGFNSYEEFAAMLQQVEEKLGRQALDNVHIHISGVQYGRQGEIRHLNLKDSDFHYIELLKALKTLEAKGVVICESPDREGDALLLQQTYASL